MSRKWMAAAAVSLALGMGAQAWAADASYMPYVEGNPGITDVKGALTNAGFEIVGDYTPYPGTEIIAITSHGLKWAAGRTEYGGYGAVLRVGITTVDGKRQIAFNNPEYVQNIYRMDADLSGVKKKLTDALGDTAEFGAQKGLSRDRLRHYHYKPLMPGFDGQIELAKYDSYDAAMKAVEAGLAQGKHSVSKVYQVSVPGKDETVFGVALGKDAGEGGDAHVMSIVDTASMRSTPHLCYEMLVSGDKVYMLGARFRIAQSFPSLTMGTFMKISDAPADIKAALEEIANGAE